ncbi:MAG TPA: lysylphosphatidylglycerol synthase transmembrane domain-containing protein, partial [Candidatus Binatia bacterium]|nr:lysylphosphatidylglycerol synthase transmembrane domain-containing protein [Candidatus Binatia bacterium]
VMLVVKLLISAGLLSFFLSRLDLKRFLQAFASAEFSYVAIVLVTYLLTQWMSAVRWTVLARPLGFEARVKEMVLYYFIGMFFNLFAPSTVGGDVSRVYYLARDKERNPEKAWPAATLHAAIAVLSDRAIGMIVLIWLAAAGLVFFPGYAVPKTVRILTFALAGGFIVAGSALPLLRRLLPENGHRTVAKLRIVLASYRAHWGAILLAMLLSLVIHLIQSWMHVLIGRSLHLEIPLTYCFILYPLVGTFAALPISFNGIGLREGGYLFLLGVIGVDAEKAVAFGLLLFLVVALDSLIGGIVFVLKRSPRPTAVVSETKS